MDSHNPSKTEILHEIRRVANVLGKAPGVAVFTQQSGIPQHHWYGKIWARWSDALTEAGLTGNQLQDRFSSDDVLTKVLTAAIKFGRVPTTPEMKILRREDGSFPNPKTVSAHFGNRSQLIEAIRGRCDGDPVYSAILASLPAPTVKPKVTMSTKVGWVYLLKSGPHFKIGRSDTLERRVREISVALPETVTLEHAIETDDPVGIEGYWHRRFSDQRANGEWFKLEADHIKAFKRRKFM